MTFETEANQNCSNLVHDLEMTSLVNDLCEEIRCNYNRSKIITFAGNYGYYRTINYNMCNTVVG